MCQSLKILYKIFVIMDNKNKEKWSVNQVALYLKKVIATL